MVSDGKDEEGMVRDGRGQRLLTHGKIEQPPKCTHRP
jgi:hypothetical protein